MRLFDSGELSKYGTNGQNRKSQERRGFRAARRLTRRRSYRKSLIKAHLQNIGLTTTERLSAFYEKNCRDIYEIRAGAAEERVTPEELAACLIHACNHRGYRDFYEEAEKEAAGGYHNIIEEQTDDEAGAEAAENKQALAAFDRLFGGSGCSTVSQFIVKHFKKDGDHYPTIRNRDTSDARYLIRREHVYDEISKILSVQSSIYPCLSRANITMALKIIFSQRDFEDGPGNPQDNYRRYTGFLGKLGKCTVYREQDRGFRSTVLADVFAVVNTLSQYRYVDINTGEIILTGAAAGDIIQRLLSNGNLTMTDVKNILKKHGLKLQKGDSSDDKALSQAVKYIKTAKRCIEEAGLDWQEYISEPQLDYRHFSRLHRLGEVISMYHTPSRRRKELAKLGFATDRLINAFAGKKISGTSNVCYQYMCEAAQAFLNGEAYGNFQAEKIRARKNAAETKENKKYLLAPVEDEEIKNNPVVFRAINETRKVLNELIRVYGSPECINIEVASDLNRSLQDRWDIKKRQDENEKRNTRDKQRIAELLSIPTDEVRGVHLDKYRLYEEQGGKCLYSGAPLGDLQEVLTDRHGRFEVDHIVPYSLILDNTLHNKALVHARENQIKGQRTPLMYLRAERRANYLAFINVMYTRKENRISSRKYQYLKLDDLYGRDAEELLRGWKSRNINDTRYITRYIVAYFKNNLIFSGHRADPVYGIKGGLTSRFRRIWLNKKTWGCDEKDRSASHLHHAVDAVVIANLTPAYVEIASDNIKLQQIFRRTKNTASLEYQQYLENCIKKMKKYYGLGEDYARELLTKTQKVPSYIPNLRDEVEIRFNDQDASLWQEQVKSFYRGKGEFVRQPRQPLVSYKQERKFRGAVTASNPIKTCDVDGKLKIIERIKIQDITGSKLVHIRTGDRSLMETLEKIFAGKDDKYTVGKYLKDNGLPHFVTEQGQRINKLSVTGRTVPQPYRKNIGDHNYSLLDANKYYCIEVYKNKAGKTSTRGLKFVDLVKKDKKLWLKPGSLPADYDKHVMYLFANDYIRVINKKGEVKFEGFYKSVFNINAGSFCYATGNEPQKKGKRIYIAGHDTVTKYHIDILGRRGGEVKCSAPLSLLAENP
ncbi:MAG: CRISPR-associated endonuclease Cas9 2 [Firmicutes bacterium ADurb.Bin373]|nr:MAG: CRISPR-associated endonuclease Cas9 2 [Firmicutes bacterium ADurb.Bin373]